VSGSLAPLLESFFVDRLMQQRQASAHTIAAYRDTFRLLLRFAHSSTGKPPHMLDLVDLDATLVGAFLSMLETDRAAGARTRNARLAAIRSFFSYAAFERPENAALIQRVLAIPAKRTSTTLVTFLNDEEVDALLAAPNLDTWTGRRDRALLLVAIRTGLRVSELTMLRRSDVRLGTGAHLICQGKGRKQRITPLDKSTRAVLEPWLRERAGAVDGPVFPGPSGRPLTRDAVRRIIDRHVHNAMHTCPSLDREGISPHTLRHTCAMRLLHAGVDIAVIALWLGHESTRTTQIYLHADLSIKQRALDRTVAPGSEPGRYHPSDPMLAFLERL
jgi:integrase/recombinase XerD